MLWNNTQIIAKRYPTSNRATYQAAADSFRIPYWDWAASATMPSSLTSSTVSINTPSGSQTVTNPLQRYVFRPPVGPPDFPTNEGFSNAGSTARDSRAQSRLTADAASINDRTYLLLSQQTSYPPFSNNAFVDSRGNMYDSLESIHDTIHGLIGGWMSRVAYSAFDPVFFLHHANVDRLFAIWQCLNPNSYVGSQSTRFGTFTINPGTIENVNTPLSPFKSDAGSTLYTSTTARSTRTFGYTVPEVLDWGVSASQLSSNCRAAVKRLYDPNNEFTPRGLSSPSSSLESLEKRQSNPNVAITIPPGLKNGTARAYRQWYANIRINKFARQSSFFIHLFLGENIPAGPDAWLSSPAFVGTFVAFVDSSMANGNGGNGFNIYGQIPLTRKLVELYNAGTIPDLDVRTMRPYLRRNLQWRAQGVEEGAGEIPVRDLRSLRVFVVSSVVRPARDKEREFPTYGELEPVPEVTNGRVGGLGEGVNSPAAVSGGELGGEVAAEVGTT